MALMSRKVMVSNIRELKHDKQTRSRMHFARFAKRSANRVDRRAEALQIREQLAHMTDAYNAEIEEAKMMDHVFDLYQSYSDPAWPIEPYDPDIGFDQHATEVNNSSSDESELSDEDYDTYFYWL